MSPVMKSKAQLNAEIMFRVKYAWRSGLMKESPLNEFEYFLMRIGLTYYENDVLPLEKKIMALDREEDKIEKAIQLPKGIA